MSASTCLTCDRPSAAGFCCSECVKALRVNLQAVIDLVGPLHEAVARLVRFAPQSGGGSGRPLVFNVDAADVGRDLESYLSGVAGAVADRAGEPVRHPGAAGAAGYLLGKLSTLNTFRGIGDLHLTLQHHLERVVSIVDTPEQPTYLGVCGAAGGDEGPACRAVLWAAADDAVTSCRVCGALHMVTSRRQEIADRVRVQLEDRVMTATDAADALIAAGLVSGDPARLVDKIRKLARPRASVIDGAPAEPPLLMPRLTRRVLGHDRPAYRVGDVLDLLNKTNRTTTTGARP